MREPHWKLEQPADLSVLEDERAGVNPVRQPARILEIRGKLLHAAAGCASSPALKTGAAVRLEWDGQLLLGQVLTTEQGGFWMEIHHMLLDTAGLNWQKQGW